MKVKIIFLGLILFLAVFLRLNRLDSYPAGFNADEAAIGYNAYSLIQTGRDEHGNSWPIHFKSFGDYKPGGYFYLVLPFVKLLGLTELAVRLPSAILAILSILLIYLLVKELFSGVFTSEVSPRRRRGPSTSEVFIPLLAALFLSVSPWHLHFSRGGWEVNAGTFFILAGLWLFFKALSQPKYYVVCCLLYVLSLYTYHSARIIVPLLGLGLIIFYRKQLFGHLSTKGGSASGGKWLIIAGAVGFLLLIPLVFSFLSPAGASRFTGVGFLAETGPLWRINELRGQHSNWNAPQVVAIHNKFIGYGLSFLENYFDHFQGEFLFLSGDVIERNRVPETGQMYLFDIPLVFLGIYFFLKNRPKNWQIIFWWLGIAPLAAAMTFQTPHALRAHNMVIPLVIISAYGLYYLLLWIKQKITKNVLLITFYFLLSLFIIWNVSMYLHQYYIHYPQTYPTAWEYGFRELVEFIKPLEKEYDKILVTDKYDQPYILFLFYLQYPPEGFQKEVVLTPRDKFGFSTVRDFGKYHFELIDWKEVKEAPNTLIIGTDEEVPDEADIIKTIYFPNGKPAFQIAET